MHRAASIRVEAFFDRDRDGFRGPTEMPLIDIEVEVSAGDGAGWSLRTAADGAIELNAVRPGGYLIRVNSMTLPRNAVDPGLASATLSAGQALVVQLAVPARPVVLLDAEGGPPGDADGGRK